MDKQELLAYVLNTIFPSEESDEIEHIDMSYKEFIKSIKALAE